MKFLIQDPKQPDPWLLIDEVLQALNDPKFDTWHAMYAFASARGAIGTLESSTFDAFVARGGKAHLIVGIDAVTNAAALERLQSLQGSQLKVDVFRTRKPGTIFHPKLSVFTGQDARLVIGSGNFTDGGLRKNVEAFASFDGVATDGEIWLDEWSRFVHANESSIGPIDQSAIDRATLNAALVKAARATASKVVADEEASLTQSDDEPLALTETIGVGVDRRTLLAEVPMNRWGQVQFDKDTAKEFFGLEPGVQANVFFEGVDEAGSGQMPETRQLVYSDVNANAKLEFSTRRDRTYPLNHHEVGRPILVVREDDSRSYTYSLFMPDDSEYPELAVALTGVSPKHGGMRRVIWSWQQLLEAAPAVSERISSYSP